MARPRIKNAVAGLLALAGLTGCHRTTAARLPDAERPTASNSVLAAGGRRTCDVRPAVGVGENFDVSCWGSQNQDSEAKVHCAAHWPGIAEDQARILQVPEAEVEVMRWVEIPDVRASAVAVGESHVCVVDLDSFVVCWGDERLRQLDVPIKLARPSDSVGGSRPRPAHAEPGQGPR